MKFNWDYAIGVVVGAALIKSLEVIYNLGVERGVERTKNALDFVHELKEELKESPEEEALD